MISFIPGLITGFTAWYHLSPSPSTAIHAGSTSRNASQAMFWNCSSSRRHPQNAPAMTPASRKGRQFKELSICWSKTGASRRPSATCPSTSKQYWKKPTLTKTMPKAPMIPPREQMASTTEKNATSINTVGWKGTSRMRAKSIGSAV